MIQIFFAYYKEKKIPYAVYFENGHFVDPSDLEVAAIDKAKEYGQDNKMKLIKVEKVVQVKTLPLF